MTKADIEFLPGTKVGNEAILHDALTRIEQKGAICAVCIWIGTDDMIHWSANASTMQAVFMAESFKSKCLNP